MRRTLVAGNWKLNGSIDMINQWVDGMRSGIDSVTAEVAVCPSYIHLPKMAESLDGLPIALGAQDVADVESGAYTGEVSAPMLKEVGCDFAIVGHSERRSLYGDTDDLVARKFAAALAQGLKPILCVGEYLEEREKGITEAVVARQLDAVLDLVGIADFESAVIAYEPVWAIGTGMTATPGQAQDVHAFIRGRLAERSASVAEKIQILYGGSVKPGNAAELFSQADIDGGLIGGASLKPEDFMAICSAAN